MSLKTWFKRVYDLVRPEMRQDQRGQIRQRGPMTHVIILDGTMSTLSEECESNAGLTYKLLDRVGGVELSVYYEAGLQWCDWRSTRDIITGGGINRQIRRAYGHLASRYRAGDRIFLFGFSRGAFAVRSLAGAIDRVGLLKAEHATERNVRLAYRHYRAEEITEACAAFRAAHCHEAAEVEMVGVWDTVKALGWRLPVIWRWQKDAQEFHNHELAPVVRNGFHALALHETRIVYTPIIWDTPPNHNGRVEQVWFRGTHGDVGGQLGGFHEARPLSNISMVWMLEMAEACGLELPEGWQDAYPQDPDAPSVGKWRGWGKIFLMRRARPVGRDPSERLHDTVRDQDYPALRNAELHADSA
ncbi:DUF2235 domain-containing protein [Roseovarius sp. E0-M6]|uniref:DUF2235 domain-containing protein n=1 Tax=Roseovarius sp. E0-M6 TaxID=3127118 RepID=UPI003010542D